MTPPWHRWLTAWLLPITLIGLAIPLHSSAAAEADLHVGSKRFTESYILAQVLAQTVASTGTSVQTLQGLGNTAIVYEALRTGQLDLYPEYVGTISREILKSDQAMSLDAMNLQLAPMGLGVAIPLGFNDGYALAVRGKDAQRLHLTTLSDLARHPELKLGLSNEFIGRADGWAGVAQRYGLLQKPQGLDHGLAYAALENGQVDVIDIYTTDAKIKHLGLQVLADDKGYFPRYDAVVLYRLDVPQKFPRAWAALQARQGAISETQMIAMNARAELDGVAFEVIARDHLQDPLQPRGQNSSAATGTPPGTAPPVAANTTTARGSANAKRSLNDKLFGDDFWRLTRQHVGLVLASVSLAMLLGIPLAVGVRSHPRLRAAVMGLSGLLQTVPSLALLAVLISWLGMIGTVPAGIALTLYSLLPIMRNTSTGLSEVPEGMRQAGLSLGMTAWGNLLWIELPLAWPTVLAGIRVATSLAIGTATIAAFIGAGGYGERIVTGLALNDNALLLAGALPAAALALLSEALFELLVSRSARRRGG